MRIALIVPGFSASERDWCIPALLDLVRILSGEHEVVVFALRYPHHRGRYRVYGADVHPLCGAQTRGIGRLVLLLRALRSVARAHDERPFDVIHAFWADEPGIVAAGVARLKRVPLVVSLMGGELVSLPDIGYGGQLGWFNRRLTRTTLRLTGVLTVGSSYLRNLAQRDAPAARLADAPLGVDPELFNPVPCASDESVRLAGSPAILSVGSLVPVKDHAMLLRVVRRLTHRFPDLHLHILGDGPLRAQLGELAASLGLAHHVTFRGELSREQLPAYYRSADLLLVTSRHESQSLVALEAAACGCAVLGTAVGLLPEISSWSACLPPGDERAFAEALAELLDDPLGLTRLRDDALAAVTRDYTLDRTVPRLVGLYRSLIEGPPE